MSRERSDAYNLHKRRIRVKLLRLSWPILYLLALVACAGETLSSPDNPLPSPLPTTPSPVSTTPSVFLPSNPAPTATPDRSPLPNSQYTLTAVLNYSQHHLAVDEQIHYVNNTGENLNELLLIVEPLHYPGVFRLNSLTWQDGRPVQGYTLDGSQMRLPLERPLPPGASADLSLTYELFLPSPVPSPDIRPIPFGYTARQTNLVDWYPFIPPYIPGQGWLAHPPGYFGEHLVYDLADFEVNIHLSGSQSTLVIAAPAPPQRDGEWYRFRHERARNFAWSVSPEYQVSTQSIQGVTISSYFFPFHVQAGEAALNTTAKALALYSQLYSPYPRSTLSVVEADFLDGMEYDGLFFLSNGFYNIYQGTPAEYLVAIAAHETAHQWFYALVGNDQALEPWLDEALCTYNEKVYYEHWNPEALDWWWQYRVLFYEPQGWIDRSIYEAGGYRAYRDAVYLNGANFLEDLRKKMGDQAFFAFLATYVRQESYQIATGKDFFNLLRRSSRIDLSSLISTYFLNPP